MEVLREAEQEVPEGLEEIAATRRSSKSKRSSSAPGRYSRGRYDNDDVDVDAYDRNRGRSRRTRTTSKAGEDSHRSRGD